MRTVSLVVLPLLALGCGGLLDTPSPDTFDPSIKMPPGSSEPGVAPPKKPGPETVADDIGTPSAIVIDGNRLVIATRATRLDGKDLATGAVFVRDTRIGPTLMITVEREAMAYEALATDGESAFVAVTDGRLLRIGFMGGDPAVVTRLAARAPVLATNGKYLYYASEAGDVGRIARDGSGEPETLASIAGSVRGIAADDAAVYVAAGAGVTRVALDTHDAKPIATTGGEPCAMVQSGTRLFWTATESVDKGAVLRAATDGGEVATVASGQFAACAIAADDKNLWFATTSSGEAAVRKAGAGLGVMRAPIAGGAPEALDGAAGAIAVAVDATHIYWMTAHAVLRLAK
jgi:hypothetical protein